MIIKRVLIILILLFSDSAHAMSRQKLMRAWQKVKAFFIKEREQATRHLKLRNPYRKSEKSKQLSTATTVQERPVNGSSSDKNDNKNGQNSTKQNVPITSDKFNELRDLANKINSEEDPRFLFYLYKSIDCKDHELPILVGILQTAIEKAQGKRLPITLLELALQDLGGIRKERLDSFEQYITNNLGETTIEKFDLMTAKDVVRSIHIYLLSGGTKNFKSMQNRIQRLLELDQIGLIISRKIKAQKNIHSENIKSYLQESGFNYLSFQEQSFLLSRIAKSLKDANFENREKLLAPFMQGQAKEVKKPTSSVSTKKSKKGKEKVDDEKEQPMPRCLPTQGNWIKQAYTNNIILYTSADQMAEGAGGAATCGYYALYNAMQLVKAIYSQDEKALNAMQKQQPQIYKAVALDDPKETTGDWAKAVLNRNYSESVAAYIKHKMIDFYLIPKNQINVSQKIDVNLGQLRENLVTIISKIAQEIYQDKYGTIVAWNINKKHKLTVSIKEKLATKIAQHANSKEIQLKIDENKTVFNVLTKNTETPLTLSFTAEEAREERNKIEHPNTPEQGVKRTGEWLNERDLQFLIQKKVEPELTAADIPKIPFVILEPDMLQLSELEDEKNHFKAPHPVPMVFILGTQGQLSTGAAHWYTLVVNKCDNKMQYLAADSWQESDRFKPSAAALQHVIEKLRQ